MSEKSAYKDYRAMSDNINNSGSGELSDEYIEKIEKIVSDEFIDKISDCLELPDDKKPALHFSVFKAFYIYFESYQNLKKVSSTREQRKVLKKILNSAVKLFEAFEELEKLPQSNKNMAEELKTSLDDLVESGDIEYLYFNPEQNKESPNYIYKKIVLNILLASDEASYDWKGYHKRNPDDLDTDNDKLSDVENDKEVQALYAIYGNAKWIPIRRCLVVLKDFWDENLEEPFSAGRHYKEIGGYNSRTIEALELIFAQIDPSISQRNIVTHMLAVNS